MFVRKFRSDSILADGEDVLVADRDVEIRDGAGDRNRLRAGDKYIVSGDVPDGLFVKGPVKKKPTKKGKEV